MLVLNPILEGGDLEKTGVLAPKTSCKIFKSCAVEEPGYRKTKPVKQNEQ